MVVIRLSDGKGSVLLEVVGNELRMYPSTDVNVKLVLRFNDLQAVSEMIKALRWIGRVLAGRLDKKLDEIFQQTIATIALENIENSPECFIEGYSEYLGSCRWAHDLREFIELNEVNGK